MSHLVNAAKELHSAIANSKFENSTYQIMENALHKIFDCFSPDDNAEFNEFAANEIMKQAYLTKGEMMFVTSILDVKREDFWYSDFRKMYVNLELDTKNQIAHDEAMLRKEQGI